MIGPQLAAARRKRALTSLSLARLGSGGANSRSNSAGSTALPSGSVTTTAQPTLAHTRALAAAIKRLSRSERRTSSPLVATILYGINTPTRSLSGGQWSRDVWL